MNKNRLTPFDAELCMMIEDVSNEKVNVFFEANYLQLVWGNSGSQIQTDPKIEHALEMAIQGRVGDRFISYENINGQKFVFIRFDKTQYPDEYRYNETQPSIVAGVKYARKIKMVDAVYFDRENINQVSAFTGGGSLIIPKEINAIAFFEFTSPANGLTIVAKEGQYVVRNSKGQISFQDKTEFEAEFETLEFKKTDEYDRIKEHAKKIFDEKFGNNVLTRFRKLREEFNELLEAYEKYIEIPSFGKAKENAEHVKDELADLNAVLFHIATIFELDNKTMLLMALDKVKGRETDPNYKRFNN